MSLINDALQRAKQQTVQTTPAPNLQLRPAEATAQPQRRSPVMFTLVFAAVLMIAGAATPLIIKSRSARSVATPAVSKPGVPIQPAVILAEPTKVPVASPNVSNLPPAVPSNPAAAPAVVAIEVKAAPVLKLNGILYQTTNPSAIVNGKTVYQNGRVGDFRVASITPGSVVLVNGSSTNILSLEE